MAVASIMGLGVSFVKAQIAKLSSDVAMVAVSCACATVLYLYTFNTRLYVLLYIVLTSEQQRNTFTEENKHNKDKLNCHSKCARLGLQPCMC